MSKKKVPEVIEDKELDQASGGIGLLLPAVQKASEAASAADSARLSSRKTGGDGTD